MADENIVQSHAEVSAELVAYDPDDVRQTVPLLSGEDVPAREQALRDEGWRVVDGRRPTARETLPRGVSAEEFARFNELLAGSVRYGMPLLSGVKKAARDVRSRRFRETLNQIERDLAAGRSPDEAFASEESRLPVLYGRLMQAGIAAGNLADVLVAVSRNLRRDTAFRRGVYEALAYPIFLFFVSLCVVSGILGVFMPQIRAMAAGMDTPPFSIVSALPAIALLGFGVILVVFLLLRTTPIVRGLHEAIMRRLPFVRALYEATVWSAAADTLGMLFKARVPAPEALALAGPALGSHWVKDAFARAAEGIRRGETLPQAFHRTASVPPTVLRAIDSGSAHGNLAASLAAVAREYRDVSAWHAQLFVNCLPALLAMLFGGVLLLVALAVLGQYITLLGLPW